MIWLAMPSNFANAPFTACELAKWRNQRKIWPAVSVSHRPVATGHRSRGHNENDHNNEEPEHAVCAGWVMGHLQHPMA